MRLALQMRTGLERETLPSDYRRACLSFIKRATTEYADGKYFEEFYQGNHTKAFSFALGLPRGVRFSGDTIFLPKPESQITLTISTADPRTAAILSNAFLAMKGKTHPVKGNMLRIEKVVLLPEKPIPQNSHVLLIRMLAPLCIREHIDNKDRYITIEDADFAQQFTRVIAYQLKDQTEFTEEEKNSVQLIPYEMKKTVVRHYGQKIACSLGVGVLTASPRVLHYLYQSGMGSRRSAGFGLFDIITVSKGG